MVSHGNRKRNINVLIVDDHQMVIEGLRSMLDAPDIQIIGEAQSGQEALKKIQVLSPDVVLIFNSRIPMRKACEVVHGSIILTPIDVYFRQPM